MTDNTDEESREMTLHQMEQLAIDHMREGIHMVRSKGQIETAREMRNIAFSNIADLMYENTEGVLCLRNLNELPREVTASIKKIKVKRDRVRGKRTFDDEGNMTEGSADLTGEVVEIELWDKQGALAILLKHYGGFEIDNKQKAEGGASENLDLLLGAIAGQGMPLLVNNPDQDKDYDAVGEDEI